MAKILSDLFMLDDLITVDHLPVPTGNRSIVPAGTLVRVLGTWTERPRLALCETDISLGQPVKFQWVDQRDLDYGAQFMNNTRRTFGSHLIQTVDTTPINPQMSREIILHLKAAGFAVEDNGHHIAVDAPYDKTGYWECALVYIENNILYVKALAQRWWLIFTAGDKQQRYEGFWQAIDGLEPVFEQFRSQGGSVVQGTVGEVDLTQAFEEVNGRKPNMEEMVTMQAAIDVLEGKDKSSPSETPAPAPDSAHPE